MAEGAAAATSGSGPDANRVPQPSDSIPGRVERVRDRRDAYRWFLPITTRWMDNDRYGHINNVVYYSFFDTAVNRLLMEQGLLDLDAGELIGLVVETQCRFHASIAFPEEIAAGVRVARIGNSSVRYELALFGATQPEAVADGHFVHVYVDRVTRRPVTLPDRWRRRLERFTT